MAGSAPQKSVSKGSDEQFRDEQEKRLTSEQLKEKVREGKSANDLLYEPRKGNRQERRSDRERLTKQALTEIRDMFQKENIALDPTDLDALTNLNAKPAKLPDFPYIIVSLAVLKDIFDFGDLLIVGIVVTTALSFVIAIILFFWTLGKTSGGWWKKKLLKKIFVKYGFTIAIEFIPFFKIIPVTTVFVLLAHYDETKIVKVINASLERLRGKNIL